MKHKTFKKIYMLCCRLGVQPLIDAIPDKVYLKVVYYLQCGYWMNIEKPVTYNEKLQWMKLYDRNPYYTKLVDKYEVKKIVESRLGKNMLYQH